MDEYGTTLLTLILTLVIMIALLLFKNYKLYRKAIQYQNEIYELIQDKLNMTKKEGEMQSSIDRLLQSSTYYETEFKNLFEYMKAVAMMTTERNADRTVLIMHKKTSVTRSMIEDGIVKAGTKTIFTLPAIKFTEETFVIEDNEEETKKEGMS